MSDKDITERLRRCGCCDSCEAADEIERLRKERDEARREVCQHEADGSDCEREYAERRGWLCFPEAEPH